MKTSGSLQRGLFRARTSSAQRRKRAALSGATPPGSTPLVITKELVLAGPGGAVIDP